MPGKPRNTSNKIEKKVTRCTHEEVKGPRTPETGHASLLPSAEQVLTLPMDNGWTKAIKVGRLPGDDDRPVVGIFNPARTQKVLDLRRLPRAASPLPES